MSYDPKTGHFEVNGRTYYSTRNYRPAEYTFNNMKALSYSKLLWADFVTSVSAAKMKCLESQGHEVDEPMFAIEKNEEYYPEFKECVKTSLLDFFAARGEKSANQLHYDLHEDKVDEAIDRGLDAVKLEELRESDINIFSAFKEELREKYGAGAAAAGDDE